MLACIQANTYCKMLVTRSALVQLSIFIWVLLIYSSCYDRLQQKSRGGMRLRAIWNPGLLKGAKFSEVIASNGLPHGSYWHSWNQISSKYEFVHFTELWNDLQFSLKLLQLHFLKKSCVKYNFHHNVCTTHRCCVLLFKLFQALNICCGVKRV
jgi:hypothetical protein